MRTTATGEALRDTLRLGTVAGPVPGEVVQGIYEVLRPLGRGGMAEVWEAFDRSLRRRVALKVPREPALTEALKREAEALAAVRHPSLPTVYHLVERAGLPCVVMERLYGVSLEEHLRQRAADGAEFQVVEALDILIALADVLSAVHSAGIAHRDVKPANIMLGPRNRLVLLDLGIFVPECVGGRNETVGTPLYMAPEAVIGRVEPGTAHLVDVYAFGVVAYELLAGRTPFRGESVPEVLLAHLDEDPPPLTSLRSGLPPELPALVAQLMAKRPMERPQGMEAVLWALRDMRPRATPRAAQRPLQVLIVDDDPDSVALLRALVERTGPRVEVRAACDAGQAMRCVRAAVPDLVLLDLELPGMNGVELCMYLRGTRLLDRCSIVSVSGTGDERDLSLLRQLGVTDYIVKGPEMARRVAAAVSRVRALATPATPPG